MISTVKKVCWKLIHSVLKIRLFEKMFLGIANGTYLYSFPARCVPAHETYSNNAFRVTKRNGLVLHAKLHDYNDWKAYWGFKEIERENLYKLIKNAEVVVDVGTNNGWLLMNVAKIILPNKGFVYGFEPHPDTYKRCIQNIEANNISNCKVFNLGCGDVETELYMQTVLESNSGQNRIINNGNNNESVKVKVCVLDDQLKNLEKIDFIKIDVEGFEFSVLRGASLLLKKHRPVLFIEIDDCLLKENHTSPAEIINFLKSQYNYTIKDAKDLKIVDEKSDFKNCHIDIICFPS